MVLGESKKINTNIKTIFKIVNVYKNDMKHCARFSRRHAQELPRSKTEQSVQESSA